MKHPLVSVIIPTKEISTYLTFDSLPAFKKQSLKSFEVIVLPNKKIAENLALHKKYPWLQIVPTGNVSRPAEKRDIGARKASGEILAFIDDDAYPEKSWLKTAIRLIDKEKLEAVCGPGILPEKASFWEKVFDEILRNWLTSGKLTYRFKLGKRQFVDDYPSMNFLIKKNVFWQLGGFNSDYWPGEDSKLCEDLVYKLKGKILYHPSVLVYHHRRRDLTGFLRQHGKYGFHRGAFFAHGDKNSRRLFYLLPTLYLFYLIFLVFFLSRFMLIGVFSQKVIYFLLLPLILPILAEFYLFLSALLNTKSLLIATATTLVLPLMHFIYSVKFIIGFAKSRNMYD